MRSARIGPCPLVRNSCEHRRARRPPTSSNPFGASPPFRRGCRPPPERERESRPGTTSRRRATPERTETGRAAPNEDGTRPSCGSSRRIPRDDRPPVGLRPRPGGGHASRDRTHRRARDWQRYVVGKVLQSPQIPEDPDAGAGLVTATAVGARAGEPAARSTIERGGRLKHSGTHPLASVAQGHDALGLQHGQCYMCTCLCTLAESRWTRGTFGQRASPGHPGCTS